MHIRKLELHGFKSFPERTVMHFDEGVSGVVGPNGCGKSNVVDAVLWCLGEQSPRVLRGRSMEDVIFAGSAERPAMGVAEVSITFGAGDEPFPGEFARCEEIQISRRLYRDGNSEYLLNQQRVRLKDIHDLFLDTGIANRMYCVIEQGRIGEIVNAKPEQRRALIEEAAGISKYKVRRKEAEQKLEETNQNLERVSEVVDDMEKRLRALDRQVERATRFRRLRTRVRQGEIYLGLARFAALTADRRALTEQLKAVSAEEETLTRRVEQRDQEIGKNREALEAREGVVGRLRDRLAELEAARREQESARQYQARESSELQRRVSVLDEQRQRAEGERVEAGQRRDEASRERAGMEASLSASEGALEASRQQSDAAEKVASARRRKVEDGKAAVMARVTDLARARASREAIGARRDDLNTRLDANRKRRDAAGTDLESLAEAERLAISAEQSAVARLESGRALLEAAQKTVGERDRERAAKLADLKKSTEARAIEERKEQGLRARAESLASLLERHDGVEDGVRAVLRTEGALGTLAEHLDVSEDQEKSVGAALGEALDYVLVRDDAAAALARAVAGGRVGIVSLEGATPAVVGWAARIRGTPEGRAAVACLLGRVDEAPDLAAALAAHRESGRAVLSACGAFVSPQSAVLVGTAPGAGTAILARRRQLHALQAEVDVQVEHVRRAETAVERATVAADTASAEADAARGALEQARLAVNEADLALRDARHLLRERNKDLGRQRDAAVQIAREEAEIVTALSDLATRETALLATIAKAEEAQGAADEALRADQLALAEEEAALTRARESLVQLRAEVGGLRDRLIAIRRAENSANAGLEAAERQIASCAAELVSARERLDVLGRDELQLSASLVTLAAEQETHRTKLDEEREQVRVARAAIGEAEARLRDLREKAQAASRQKAELEREGVSVRDEINRIRDQLEERYEVSVAGMLDRLERDGHVLIEVDEAARGPVIPGEDPDRWAKIEPVEDMRLTGASLEDADSLQRWVDLLQKTRNQLSHLGEVNLVAVEEYVEVAATHRALDTQRKDLDESVKALRQSIARLNRTSRERFRETFDRVDACFRDLYPKLVGGGQARLVLTNEDDLLETGVEVYVQPPGKRLVHLSLLSGGETAMCAIALVFSLFRVKPSPFCLLDEVDAPLDESNGARFNGMLREMAEMSQFIVITHNRKTMESMDTLYGITMPAPGVSRLVSVRMT